MNGIATSSVDEGLDFAFNLIMPLAAEAGSNELKTASKILETISTYVSLRYAGELILAFEYLETLSEQTQNQGNSRKEQFDSQMSWLRNNLKEKA